MATTQTTHETVSTQGQPDDYDHDDEDVVFERRSWNYAYVGRDAEGRFHHVDRKRGRIVVTAGDRERDDSEAIPRFRVRGPTLHTEAIEDDETLRRWIEFVDEEVCGWAERPVSAADTLQDALTEGM
ncbi:hypothetical protein [Salinilacihabitans rarus]|uniref:hypothetical protein n=1 Tax=Salinilacihabitans rarus TaxID=2961596 RepID=UPI0020C8B193|nr:hypothetical protein [Salinilacihabitans rarus]